MSRTRFPQTTMTPELVHFLICQLQADPYNRTLVSTINIKRLTKFYHFKKGEYQNPPNTPQLEPRKKEKEKPSKEGKKTKTKRVPSFIDNFPDEFKNNRRFQIAWQDWEDYRKTELGITLTEKAAIRQINKLTKHSVQDAIQMIDAAIENNWRTVWEGVLGNGKKAKPKQTESNGKYDGLETELN